MKDFAIRLFSCAFVIAGLGCGGGSNVTYYKAAVSPLSALTGTNCQTPNPDSTVTLSGIDGNGTIAVYAQPDNKYFLDLGPSGALFGLGGDHVGLTGTQSNGSYSFTGTWTNDQKGSVTVNTALKVTVTLTPNGSAMTGKIAFEFSCTSSNAQRCGNGNPLASVALGGTPMASMDGKDFDCSTSESLLGAQLTNVVETSSAATTTPAPPAE